MCDRFPIKVWLSPNFRTANLANKKFKLLQAEGYPVGSVAVKLGQFQCSML